MLGAVRTVVRVGRIPVSLVAGVQHHGVVPSRGEQRDLGVNLGHSHFPGQACVRNLSGRACGHSTLCGAGVERLDLQVEPNLLLLLG